MPTICRLLSLSPDQATALIAEPKGLAQAIESAKVYTDVYRYWHGIQYLLAQHSPDTPAADWLGLGQAVSSATETVPATRVILPQEVAQLDAALGPVDPDSLTPHYDAEAMDKAGVYPNCWVAWEETFDPLGQVLEHYFFLQQFVQKRAAAGDALMLHFVFLDDGSDD